MFFIAEILSLFAAIGLHAGVTIKSVDDLQAIRQRNQHAIVKSERRDLVEDQLTRQLESIELYRKRFKEGKEVADAFIPELYNQNLIASDKEGEFHRRYSESEAATRTRIEIYAEQIRKALPGAVPGNQHPHRTPPVAGTENLEHAFQRASDIELLAHLAILQQAENSASPKSAEKWKQTEIAQRRNMVFKKVSLFLAPPMSLVGYLATFLTHQQSAAIAATTVAAGFASIMPAYLAARMKGKHINNELEAEVAEYIRQDEAAVAASREATRTRLLGNFVDALEKEFGVAFPAQVHEALFGGNTRAISEHLCGGMLGDGRVRIAEEDQKNRNELDSDHEMAEMDQPIEPTQARIRKVRR